MRIWENHLPKRTSYSRLTVIAAATLAILSAHAPSASAQVLYDSLSHPVTNQTGQIQSNKFGLGTQYTLNYGFSDVINNRVVTPLMADDVFLQPEAAGGSFNINSISFSVFNQVLDGQFGASGQMTVTPYLTIWSPDGSTPEVHGPSGQLAFFDGNPGIPGYQPANDSPGTKMFRVALPDVTIGAAVLDGSGKIIPSSATVIADSSVLNGLTLPNIGSKYWFGLVFDQAVTDPDNVAQQKARMARIALGLYSPTAPGHSADVHFETGDQSTQTGFPNNPALYPPGSNYLGAGGPGYYDANNVWQQGYETNFNSIYGTNDPTAQSNFGWLVSGTLVVPEPTVGALLMFGLPFAGVVLRRRRK